MSTNNTQSFIVSGTILSFECDIDLAAPDAKSLRQHEACEQDPAKWLSASVVAPSNA